MPEREPLLLDSMSQFDPRDRDRRIGEGLESSHRRTASLDGSMVLLNDIVEVLAAAHLHILPLRILPPQEPERAVTRHMAVQSNFLGHRVGLVARAFLKKACAAATPRSGRSRKSTVITCLSTAR